jgi:MraZ protein
VDNWGTVCLREGYTLYVGQSGEKWGAPAPVPLALRRTSMFLGEFQHSIDAKGRMAIPAKYRTRIERGAVLTRGVDSCLYVYPMEVWEAKAAALEALITDPRKLRYVERHFFGGAVECELDAQGRIIIPARYRSHAGLRAANGNGSVEAIILGARERFEIWSPDRWEAYLRESEPEDLASLPLPF